MIIPQFLKVGNLGAAHLIATGSVSPTDCLTKTSTRGVVMAGLTGDGPAPSSLMWPLSGLGRSPACSLTPPSTGLPFSTGFSQSKQGSREEWGRDPLEVGA